MTSVVIDASVAIKWVIDEQGSTDALALRSYRMIAPDLLVAECANILWKKVCRRELMAEEASLAAQLLARADIDLFPMRRMIDAATRFSMALDHPAYDCFYLALAVAEDSVFVTADERLIQKVQAGMPSIRCLPLSVSAGALGRGGLQ